MGLDVITVMPSHMGKESQQSRMHFSFIYWTPLKQENIPEGAGEGENNLLHAATCWIHHAIAVSQNKYV